MRAPRSLSLPIAVVVTCAVWYGFLWTMQHAPVSRPRVGSGTGDSRSQGGLANPFASAVVQFFDDADPRAVEEDSPTDEPGFRGEIPDLLPFPDESREAIARDLPEVFANPSLSSRNLFRSDVDLDGDGHLDMALLIRLSRDRALGVVLAYTPKQRFQWSGSFRMAGKFACDLPGPQDFERCFQVFRAAGGGMHLASFSLVPPRESAEAVITDPRPSGWRLMRLEDGTLRDTGQIETSCSPLIQNRLVPVPPGDKDILLHIKACPERHCRPWRYAAKGDEPGQWIEAPESAPLCEEEASP